MIFERSFYVREGKEGRKRSHSNMKENSSKTSKLADIENSNVGIGTARFTFKNGDSYDGKYQVNIDRRTLVKQG